MLRVAQVADMGYGLDLMESGGIDGPRCITGAKTERPGTITCLLRRSRQCPAARARRS